MSQTSPRRQEVQKLLEHGLWPEWIGYGQPLKECLGFVAAKTKW